MFHVTTADVDVIPLMLTLLAGLGRPTSEIYKLLSCDEKLKEVCDSSFNFFLIFL